VAGGKEAWRLRSTQKFTGQPGQNLVNGVKILTPQVCTGFGWKEEFRIGETEFVWGSKQARQDSMCKVEERDRVMLATTQINPGSASG
jgi:hypothetical protein